MRRTKIVCTIGPASESPEIIAALIRQGMDVARLNFSHGTLEDHDQRFKLIRGASKKSGRRVAILMDTRGPEVRIKGFNASSVELCDGSRFCLTTDEVEGDQSRVSVTYRELPRDLRPGNRILIDDGMIELEVEELERTEVRTVVVNGGILYPGKSINVPGVRLNLPSLSKEDERDITFALERGVEFIAASFIRHADDVLAIRGLIEKRGNSAKIIAKIENREGVNNFEGILKVADGVMIARGDLGVEIPAEDVPLVQKSLIKECNRAGKPVITATQMLDSMIRNPRPTRAEASDVANAIFDGTDAVMLSGETAVGAFPVEAVTTMAKIAVRTEEALEYRRKLEHFELASEKTITDAISYATCRAAQELGASAIISSTQSGHTARMVSKYKPKAPIVAVTPSEKVAAELTLTWGVYPLLCPPTAYTDEIFNTGVQVAVQSGLISHGDLVIFTAGVPVGMPGTTNFMRIDTVGEILIQGLGVGKASVTGIVHVALSSQEAAEIEEGQILVTGSTDKNYLPAMEKAAAVITEVGGLTSHAAIVGLNLGVPVVVRAADATRKLSSGQLITVDTVRGLIYQGRATVY